MKPSRTIEVEGHIFDSFILQKILDTILESKAEYLIEEIKLGKEKTSTSYARLLVSANNESTLKDVLDRVKKHGACEKSDESVLLGASPKDRTLPDGFYSTTNMITEILLDGDWIPVEDTAMDCAIVVDKANRRSWCRKLSQIKQGDSVVMGHHGIRTQSIQKQQAKQEFSFMDSDVSSEKPKTLVIEKIAKRIAEIKRNGEGKVLFVLGPAVVHTKSQQAFTQMIEMGCVDYLFAGNALATHDIEAALFGTSLGVSQKDGSVVEGGHSHHLRAINKIHQFGGIEQAVAHGELTTGIMHSCVKNGVDFVLAGSIRDDGPLPDVITDTIAAQCEMRKRIKDTKMAVMVSTMLHSIAVGNLLPEYVETICVDINPAVVTKLADRGTSQAIGLVTDTECFIKELAQSLQRELKDDQNIDVSTGLL